MRDESFAVMGAALFDLVKGESQCGVSSKSMISDKAYATNSNSRRVDEHVMELRQAAASARNRHNRQCLAKTIITGRTLMFRSAP